MSTKLEKLVNALRNEELDEEINNLILSYFTNQNANEFILADTTYKVISEHEMDDMKYEYCEELYYEYFEELTNLVENSRNTNLIRMLDTIDMEDSVKIILNNLSNTDFYENQNLVLLAEEEDYYIISVNEY